MKIGTTFSHPHLKYLKFDPMEAFSELVKLDLGIVRLGLYWNEIEKEEKKIDFTNITNLLDACENANLDVVLTVGMKAPRWPEFYFPTWVKNKKPVDCESYVLNFVETSIVNLKKYKCIKYWQIENEPLDPSGPKKMKIPYSLLIKEIELVRSLDTRKVVTNVWANKLSKRGYYKDLAAVADVVGLDIYYRVPSLLKGYHGPSDRDIKIKTILSGLKSQIWISELQAEPWEKDELVSSSQKPPSMNEKLLFDNYERVLKFSPKVILLWGFEYWLLRKSKGDFSLWNAVKKLIEANKGLT